MGRREGASQAESFFNMLALLADPEGFQGRLVALENAERKAAEAERAAVEEYQKLTKLKEGLAGEIKKAEEVKENVLRRLSDVESRERSVGQLQVKVAEEAKDLRKRLDEFHDLEKQRERDITKRVADVTHREHSVGERERIITEREQDFEQRLEAMQNLVPLKV